MRRRSTARARRPASALMIVPIAVSRKTGATASWMVRLMSKTCASRTGMARILLPLLEPGEDDRDHAEDDDPDDDRRQVVADPGDVAEEVPGIGDRGDPRDRARDVEEREAQRLHLPQPRHERDVGPDDREEPRDHHRLASVALIESVRLLQVHRIEEA